MSERRPRPEAGRPEPRRPTVAQAPLLDRLFDEAPERAQDQAAGYHAALDRLRRSVRQDLEMLLNARPCWRTPPESMTQLATSPITYGIPDCTGPRFADRRERDRLRAEIEGLIRRFEPRFLRVSVSLAEASGTDSTLRLHIDALLHAEPAPEPVAFDSVVDPASAVSVRLLDV